MNESNVGLTVEDGESYEHKEKKRDKREMCFSLLPSMHFVCGCVCVNLTEILVLKLQNSKIFGIKTTEFQDFGKRRQRLCQ